jgi:3-hydroxyisobutyrate dehydrogenase-like beta-hydroxyacid dehydrogenase
VHEIVAKDLGLARSVAGELGVDAPFASLAADLVPGALAAER